MLNEVQLTKLCETVVANCYSNKKSDERFHNEVRETINTIFKYISFFNTIDEYQTNVNGVSLDDIKVASEFAPFILPAVISVDPTDYSAVNFVKRDIAYDSNGSFQFDLSEYLNAHARYCGYFRRSASESLISLRDARKSLPLFDVLDRCYWLSLNDKVHFNIGDKPFIPYLLSDGFNLQVYKTGYYNWSVDELVLQYIREMYL